MNSPLRIIDKGPVSQRIAQIAAMRSVHSVFAKFLIRENELRRLQMEVARIPAPPFGEAVRAEWLREKFLGIGLQEIEVDEVGNVIGVLEGSDRKAPATAVTAHLDTVFPADTDIEIHEDRDRIYGPGVSDNAGGITAMLAVAGALRDAQIRCEADVIFIGNVGEEGEGDLRGMRHIFENRPWSQRIGSTIVIDGSGIVQFDRRRNIVRDEDGVIVKFGVRPRSIPDFLALVGDSADGYPGLAGWGLKAAALAFSQYPHLEDIPKDWREWHASIRRARPLSESLFTNWNDALLFRTLATLRADVPVFESIEDLRWRGPNPKFRECCQTMASPELFTRATSAASRLQP